MKNRWFLVLVTTQFSELSRVAAAQVSIGINPALTPHAFGQQTPLQSCRAEASRRFEWGAWEWYD